MTAQVSGQTLLVFVGIPVLVVAVVGLLVFAPSIAKGPRYRPGLSWWAPPVWIGGPSERSDPVSAPELEPGQHDDAVSSGGASASW